MFLSQAQGVKVLRFGRVISVLNVIHLIKTNTVKKIVLLALFAGQFLCAQNNTAATCATPHSLCNGLGLNYPNTANGSIANDSQASSYGCLTSTPNPTWFNLPLSQSGTWTFAIDQVTDGGEPVVPNFIVWGPFDGTIITCGPAYLNPSTQVACSESSNQFTLPNGMEGSNYIVMVTNNSNQAGNIIFSLTSGPAGADNLDCFEPPLGIKDLTTDSFMLYPNPSKNTVTIAAATKGDTITAVKIYDLTGKAIYTTAVNAISHSIDSSAFAAGTYFVEVSSANAKTVKKLIIE